MNRRFLALIISCWLLQLANVAQANTNKQDIASLIRELKDGGYLVYGMVPKNTEEPFFQQIAQGCATTAEQLGVKCVYYGATTENARLQTKAILELVKAGVDGLAIAGIKEHWINKSIGAQLRDWGKPIIAFDSPIHSSLAAAYIGTNNYLLGKALGNEIIALRPAGGTYCIQTERPDSPNHNERMRGIVDAFAESDRADAWQSISFCPIEHFGNFAQGTQQMAKVLTSFKPDVFISTGGGPQFLPQTYRAMMTPFRKKISAGELLIANIDTTPEQIQYLKEGLSTVNVGQQPYEMGKWSVSLLKMLTDGQPVPLIIYTGLTHCNAHSADYCTLTGPVEQSATVP